MHAYYNGNNFSSIYTKSGSSQISLALALGNIGQAETFCTHHFFGIEVEKHYTCPKGKLSGIVASGLLQSQMKKSENNTRLEYDTKETVENLLTSGNAEEYEDVFKMYDYCSDPNHID